jgi:replicative DNA helicase
MNMQAPIDGPDKVPEDIDLEQAVLGCCFAHSHLIDTIMGACSPLDFFHEPHPSIAEAIFALHLEQQPITTLTVSGRMATDGALESIGGRKYLEAMRSAAPAGGVISIARNLADLRVRREAIAAALDCQEALRSPGTGIIEALRPMLEIADHAAEAIGKRESMPIRAAADLMLKHAEERAQGKTIVAATTGIQMLDETIGGLQAGNLIVYAGRPGMGKTALLMTTALRTALEGRPVLFFSLEMTQEALLQRVGADMDFDKHPERPLSYSWFYNGSAKQEQIGRMAEALLALPETLTVFDRGSMNIHEIAALCRAHAARTQGMGLVVIDYLQKVTAGDRYRGNRVQEVTEISGAAKALAMRLKWPVVVGAQLNRGVEAREEKRPNLTDLRESGSIEQDADAVIGLYRPGYYVEKRKPALGSADPGYAAWEVEYKAEKNRLDLLVLKNRNGAEDSLSVFCDMRASAIRNEKPRGVA